MRCLLLLLLPGLLWLRPVYAEIRLADVEVRVRWFIADFPIRGATVHVLNEGEGEHGFVLSRQTDRNGKISFQWPVGEELTLQLLPSPLNARMQSATVVVPEEGLTGEFGEITFQAASVPTYIAFRMALRMKYFSLGGEDMCTVVTTVTPPDKSLYDCPHGLAGVQVDLDPPNYDQKYYFGIIEDGVLDCKMDFISFFGQAGINYLYHRLQNPFHTRNRNNFSTPIGLLEMDRTSEDGGVMFLNVQARAEPYTMVARDPLNPNRRFSSPKFYCYKGGLVNASPPHGVTLIEDETSGTCSQEDKVIEESFRDEKCLVRDAYNKTVITPASPAHPTFHHWNMLFQIFREFLHE